VTLTIALGYLAALVLPGLLGIDRRYGAAGLTASAGVAGWVEFALLRSRLNRRIGRTGVAGALLVRLWGAAIVAAAVAWGMVLLLREMPPRPAGLVVLGTFGAVYVLVTYFLGVPQARTLLGRLVR
jgi:putative peptidoglycan lipid II flippase